MGRNITYQKKKKKKKKREKSLLSFARVRRRSKILDPRITNYSRKLQRLDSNF